MALSKHEGFESPLEARLSEQLSSYPVHFWIMLFLNESVVYTVTSPSGRKWKLKVRSHLKPKYNAQTQTVILNLIIAQNLTMSLPLLQALHRWTPLDTLNNPTAQGFLWPWLYVWANWVTGTRSCLRRVTQPHTVTGAHTAWLPSSYSEAPFQTSIWNTTYGTFHCIMYPAKIFTIS